MEKPQKQKTEQNRGASIIGKAKLQWNYFWHFTSLGHQPLIPLRSINTLFAANGRSAKRLGWLRMGGSTGDSGGTGHFERSFSGLYI